MSWRYPKNSEMIPKAVRLRDEALRLRGKADALQRRADALMAEADAVEELDRQKTGRKGKPGEIYADLRRRESKSGSLAIRKSR